LGHDLLDTYRETMLETLQQAPPPDMNQPPQPIAIMSKIEYLKRRTKSLIVA
jgi:hypothetical protein